MTGSVRRRRRAAAVMVLLGATLGAGWVSWPHPTPKQQARDAETAPDEGETASAPSTFASHRRRASTTPDHEAPRQADPRQLARSIIATSRAAYAACDTYEDEAIYDIAFRGEARFEEESDIRTSFAGRGAVRFVFTDRATPFGFPELTTTLVEDDAGVQVMTTGDGRPETFDALQGAVAALRGVSHGMVTAVLPLLPAGLSNASVLDGFDPLWTGNEPIDHVDCDRVEGTIRHADGTLGSHVTLWIARSDSMIRRWSEDYVEAEDARRARVERNRVELEERLRALRKKDPRLPDDFEARLRKSAEEPITTFASATYRPKCNADLSDASSTEGDSP